jgi:hypothetical protein
MGLKGTRENRHMDEWESKARETIVTSEKIKGHLQRKTETIFWSTIKGSTTAAKTR